MTLAQILRDSSYKLTQFSQSQINKLEQSIIVKESKGKKIAYVNCLVRKKQVQLKPEEVVRQLFLMVLNEEYGYSFERMELEYVVSFGREKKRADIVIFDKQDSQGVYYKGAIKGQKRDFLKDLKNSTRFEYTVLDGNIGYLDINTFMFHNPKGKRLINKALKDLRNVDALIIDVRNNRGGNGNMANYLVGQFLPSKTLISTVHKRKGDHLKPTKRYISKGKADRFQSNDVPIYILINDKTASAGESLAYGLQSFERASIIGEQSAGAAHAMVEKPINKSFLILLPNEKHFYCMTSTDYEYIGVIPNILVNPGQALELTLERIDQKAHNSHYHP